jgi:hypothetical protein
VRKARSNRRTNKPGIACELEVFRIIGEESRRKGTDKLSSRDIDRIIKAARAQKPKRG